MNEKLIAKWLISAGAIIVTSYLLPGVALSGLLTALVVALVLGLVNVIIRPLLLLFTLPLNILTLGLFTFVINALMVMLTSTLVKGFDVANFWWALLFSLVLTFVDGILEEALAPKLRR